MWEGNKEKHFQKKIYLPPPHGVKEVIEKFVIEPKLQNMTYKTHKNETKSKRLASYGNFCKSRLG